ncbi:hypothetical protein B0H13DRAFT_2081292 [Mycena leptocephala]|nr:hypothetical protein B0H13DRAFT_2081292 [Mycena leptocephala]
MFSYWAISRSFHACIVVFQMLLILSLQIHTNFSMNRPYTTRLPQRTVEFVIWNIVGTGFRAIPYDGYSTINKMKIKYKIS